MIYTELYLENTLIELNDAVQFAITKQFEDIQNPTIVISDWSKTVSVPGTERNNRFFGHIYNPDMQIANSSVSKSFINFDPTKKLDMRLMYNGQLLLNGYAKMLDIKQSKGNITYDLTLNAQLGKMFCEMQKIRFDQPTDSSTTDDIKYVIDTSVFFYERMDVSTMDFLWKTGQIEPNVYNMHNNDLNPALRVNDVIGFCPNNSFNDDFDYKTYQVDKNHSELFTDRLSIGQPSLVSQIPADTIYPNGLTPREIGEYRTYNQLPFIYINKLMQIFIHKVFELTGYSIKLDEHWFCPYNPYWYDYVVMLQPLQYHNEILKDDSKSNWYGSYGTVVAMDGQNFNATYDSSMWAQKLYGQAYYEEVPIANWDSNNRAYTFTSTMDTGYCNNVDTFMVRTFAASDTERIRFRKDGGLVIEMKHVDANGTVVGPTVSVLACSDDTNLNTANYDGVYKVGDWTYNNSGHQFSFGLSDAFTEDDTAFDSSFGHVLSAHWIHGQSSGTPLMSNASAEWATTWPINLTSSGSMTVRFGKEIRSGSKFKLSDLWNFDYSIFDIILNYCKLFRLFIDVDEKKKCLHFRRQVEFFEHYTIEDWTDKLDMNRDYIIKPVYWGSQNVLLNYDESETKIGEVYQQKYGIVYGDKKIITDYKFDNTTTSLFSGLKPTIVSTDNVLSWTSTYDKGAIVYSRSSTELTLHIKDGDGKMTNPFGQFGFCSGSAVWDNGSNLRAVCLSDDTPLQQAENKYYYSQSSVPECYRLSTAYMKVDVAKARNLAIIGKPFENYSTTNWTSRTDIYDTFWRKYINERYNIQSKMLTCYLDIKPVDFLTFRWNKFIKIDNQLYIMNKIYDYDVMSSAPTKCDLLNVRDITAYNTDDFQIIDGKVSNDGQFARGESGTVDIYTNTEGTWLIESPGVFGWSSTSGTGSQIVSFTVSNEAEPRDYTVTIVRTDSPFSSLSEKEHVRLTITVVPPNEE